MRKRLSISDYSAQYGDDGSGSISNSCCADWSFVVQMALSFRFLQSAELDIFCFSLCHSTVISAQLEKTFALTIAYWRTKKYQKSIFETSLTIKWHSIYFPFRKYQMPCDSISKINNIWVIDFNGISNHPGLFNAKGFGNHFHCMFIFIFLYGCFIIFLIFFSHDPIEYEFFSNRSIWPVDNKY